MAATGTLISVQEYLRTATDPDCEYVGGVLEERAVGEYDHATWQIILAGYFLVREKELGILSRPELRIQISADNFRVPDVTLLSPQRSTRADRHPSAARGLRDPVAGRLDDAHARKARRL